MLKPLVIFSHSPTTVTKLYILLVLLQYLVCVLTCIVSQFELTCTSCVLWANCELCCKCLVHAYAISTSINFDVYKNMCILIPIIAVCSLPLNTTLTELGAYTMFWMNSTYFSNAWDATIKLYFNAKNFEGLTAVAARQ